MFLQKLLSLIIFFLSFSFSPSTMCSQEQIFYFRGESCDKEILGIPNSTIKKVPIFQELCLTAFKTDEPKQNNAIRSFQNVNSEHNPIVVPNEAFKNMAITSYTLEQLKNKESEKNFLAILSDANNASRLCCAALKCYDTRYTQLRTVAITKFFPQDLLPNVLPVDSLQEETAIVFPNPETVVTTAMCPDGSCYIVARDETTMLNNSTRIDTYARDNNILSELYIPNYRFRKEQKKDSHIYFYGDYSKILYARKGFFLIAYNTQTQDAKNMNTGGVSPCVNPTDDSIIACVANSLRINDKELSFKFYIDNDDNEGSTPMLSGLDWNKSGSHLLCYASHQTRNYRNQWDNAHEIFIINYHNFLDQANNNPKLSDHRTFLDNHSERILAAKWLPNNRYAIGISALSIFMWDTQDLSQIHKITSKDCPAFTKLQHDSPINYEKTETCFFRPGKIAFSEKKCFIEQAISGHIIMVDLDTWNPQILALEKLAVDKKDHKIKDNIKVIFNSEATLLFVFYKNILSWHDTQTGEQCGTINISPEKNILSLEFNATGEELYLRHDNGFDIYKFVAGETNMEKLINQINQVKIHTIHKKPQKPFLERIIETITPSSAANQVNHQAKTQQTTNRPLTLITLSAVVGGFLLWKYLKG